MNANQAGSQQYAELWQRRRHGGLFYERVTALLSRIIAALLLGVGAYQSGALPPVWHEITHCANGFWALTAVICLLDTACLFFTIGVFWFTPEQRLIPHNQLTKRFKQYVKTSVSVTVFGLSAYWGAMAGELIATLHASHDHRLDDGGYIIGQIAGTPLKLLLPLAWVVVIGIGYGDLWVIGANGRKRALIKLRRWLYRPPSDKQLRFRTRYSAPSLAQWMRSRRIFVPFGMAFTTPVMFAMLTFFAIPLVVALATSV
jgi:hypothetical protein